MCGVYSQFLAKSYSPLFLHLSMADRHLLGYIKKIKILKEKHWAIGVIGVWRKGSLNTKSTVSRTVGSAVRFRGSITRSTVGRTVRSTVSLD